MVGDDGHERHRPNERHVAKKTMERLQLNVKGMSCDGCAQGIVAALRFIPGVNSVEARYAQGTVTVEYDAKKVDPAALRSEIEALEYEVVG